MPFQCSPDRLPVLRRRFHHRFFGSLHHQPSPQVTQLCGSTSELPPFNWQSSRTFSGKFCYSLNVADIHTG